MNITKLIPTTEGVVPPAIGDVELLVPVEQPHVHHPITLLRVRRALGPCRHPVLGPQCGRHQGDAQARAEERHKDHPPLVQVHRRGCPVVSVS